MKLCVGGFFFECASLDIFCKKSVEMSERTLTSDIFVNLAVKMSEQLAYFGHFMKIQPKNVRTTNSFSLFINSMVMFAYGGRILQT